MLNNIKTQDSDAGPSGEGSMIISQKTDMKSKEEMKKKEEQMLRSMSQFHQDMFKKAAAGIQVDILARPVHPTAERMMMDFVQEEGDRDPPDPAKSNQMQVDQNAQFVDVVMQQGDSGSELPPTQMVSQ